jgi:hypothetical protein
MSDLVKVAMIAGLCTAVPAMLTTLVTWWTQRGTLQKVEVKVDGRFTEQKTAFEARFDEQALEIALYRNEVVRLQQQGATTPYGKPSPENPVTLTAGEPQTEKKKAG